MLVHRLLIHDLIDIKEDWYQLLVEVSIGFLHNLVVLQLTQFFIQFLDFVVFIVYFLAKVNKCEAYIMQGTVRRYDLVVLKGLQKLIDFILKTFIHLLVELVLLKIYYLVFKLFYVLSVSIDFKLKLFYPFEISLFVLINFLI